MSDGTFTTPDLTTFCRLDELGLVVVGQRLETDRAVLACRVVEPDDWCRRCGCQGVPRDTVTRELAHGPFGWRPTTLLVTVRRYRCTGCGHVWRQDTTAAAEPRAKLSRAAVRWALVALVAQHLTVARIAEALDLSWDTANDAVLAEGRRLLIDDPARFDGARVIGVDEHVWRHTRRGDKYLLRSVAAADGDRSLSTPLTRYYAEEGTPWGSKSGPVLTCLFLRFGVCCGRESASVGSVHRLSPSFSTPAPRSDAFL